MQEVTENTISRKIKKVSSIDFNCDLAQGYGVYQNEDESKFLDYVSSVNISAGFHAGDPLTIKEALLKAKEHEIVLGANIGFNDIQGFGMREMSLTEDEIEALVIYQVGALMSFAKAYNVEIEQVRLHGAMYKQASENFTFSCAVAKAIKKCSQWLTYVCAAGDITEKVGEFVNLPIAREVTLNAEYNIDGTINYQGQKITDMEVLTRRLQRYLQYSQIDNNAQGTTYLEADTLHFGEDTFELIKKASELITPKPVNYNKVESSGWV